MIKYIFRLLIHLFRGGSLTPKADTHQHAPEPDIKPVVEHRTFTETGEFILSDKFEKIWIDENVNWYDEWDRYKWNHNYVPPIQLLNDDEYLDYKIWEDMNHTQLYKKHIPYGILVKGENPNIIFHGGCLGCASQRIHGFERCKGCQFFRTNWDKPDLKIGGEWSATMDVNDLFK